ncbi:MAG: alpha/beta fold hydrolase [Pseudomonadota bacterium]
MPTSLTARLRTLPRRARRLRESAGQLRDNAVDWLRRDELVLAERTPYEEIFREDIVCVRHYLPLTEKTIDLQGERVPVASARHAVPLVLVSPLAVTMRIYDLFPDRSLVKYLLARGFDVYLVDWGRPTARHDRLHLADFYAGFLPRALAAVRAHSGTQKLSLHGWSFGGLFALCHAASGDPDIVNLALVGAPCDYHANGELGKQYRRLAKQLRALEQRTGFRIHRTSPRLWRSPGWMNALMFKAVSPAATVQGYLELLRNLHDREFVAAHATNAAFLDDMTAYPGGVVQDIVQHLWVDNVLPQGQLPAAAGTARFAAVDAALLAVAGSDDTIVTRDCTQPILDLVSSRDKTLLDAPGGHMGILGGSRAPATIWKPVADWLATRSD